VEGLAPLQLFHIILQRILTFLQSDHNNERRNQGWQVFASQWKKPFFSIVKTGLAKIVFAGKNNFLPNYYCITIKFWLNIITYTCAK